MNGEAEYKIVLIKDGKPLYGKPVKGKSFVANSIAHMRYVKEFDESPGAVEVDEDKKEAIAMDLPYYYKLRKR